ncbi:MAG: hypothetical protein ATN36_07090 [Epulopiscium sp. Nele67-Bin005]|nr:MAG: hypothetical protein ATN36_07090 [Epulopiscium sp. Nele67-Bin005]
MNFTDYNKIKTEIVDCLSSISHDLTTLKTETNLKKAGLEAECEKVLNVIDEKTNDVSKGKFIISVFGHFSNGKSTFLNSLMGFGESVLIEDELASTATITKLCYPPAPNFTNKADIIFQDGAIQRVNIDEIGKYSARNNEFEVEKQISEVVLYVESDLLKNGVEIIDTPGFNSTYEIHTEIAKQYVERSDACIYLFSYEQPATRAEIEFLQGIKEKIERVFLVLNKIDMCDLTESTVDEILIDVKKKLENKQVTIPDRGIYPISAKLEKEGIRDNSEEKRIESKFEPFLNDLTDYLASDKNIHDRLVAPLNNTKATIKQFDQFLQTKLVALNISQDEIDEAIRKIDQQLQDKRNQIKENDKHLKREYRKIFNSVRLNLEDEIHKLKEDIDEELGNISSQFEFETYNPQLLGSSLKNSWHYISRTMIKDIEELIEDSIIDDTQLENIQNRANKIFTAVLDFGDLSISKPELDLSELENFDKEIQLLQKELEQCNKNLLTCIENVEEKEKYSYEIENLKQKRDRLEREKREELDRIGTPQIHRYLAHEILKESHGGLGIMDFFVGKKAKTVQIERVDNSEFDSKNELIDKIKLEKEVAINEIEQKISVMQSEATGIRSLQEKETEQRYKKQELSEKITIQKNRIFEEKIRFEQQQTKSVIKKMIREIYCAYDEYQIYIQQELDKRKKPMEKILNEIIEQSKLSIRELEQQKEIQSSTKGKSAAEIKEEQLINLTVALKLNEAFEQLSTLRKEIEL